MNAKHSLGIVPDYTNVELLNMMPGKFRISYHGQASFEMLTNTDTSLNQNMLDIVVYSE